MSNGNIEIARLAFQLLEQSLRLSPNNDMYIGLEPIVDPFSEPLIAFEKLYHYLKALLVEKD